MIITADLIDSYSICSSLLCPRRNSRPQLNFVRTNKPGPDSCIQSASIPSSQYATNYLLIRYGTLYRVCGNLGEVNVLRFLCQVVIIRAQDPKHHHSATLLSYSTFNPFALVQLRTSHLYLQRIIAFASACSLSHIIAPRPNRGGHSKPHLILNSDFETTI